MGKARNRVDGGRSRTAEAGVDMDNKNILNIGSLLTDFNQAAAVKFGKLFQEKKETDSAQAADYADREPIGDYDATYQELCHLLDNTKHKWGIENTEQNLFNAYYQRDLLYLYDCIALDMDYLSAYPDRNEEWLEKLLELKYEIRNLL